MKIILTIIGFSILAVCGRAQDKSLYILPEFSVFENINNGDFTHEGDYPVLKAPNTTGVSLGVSFRKEVKQPLFFSWGLGWNFNPQRMTYPAYTDGVLQMETQRFTNQEFWLRLMIGVEVWQTKKGFFDLAAGVKFIYGLNGKGAPDKAYYAPYTDEATGKEYNYLIAYNDMNWGDTRAFEDFIMAPAVPNFAGQLGYNFRLKQQRLLRVALGFSSNFGVATRGNRKNEGFAVVFNQKREQVGKTVFNDRYTQLSLNISVAL